MEGAAPEEGFPGADFLIGDGAVDGRGAVRDFGGDISPVRRAEALLSRGATFGGAVEAT